MGILKFPEKKRQSRYITDPLRGCSGLGNMQNETVHKYTCICFVLQRYETITNYKLRITNYCLQ